PLVETAPKSLRHSCRSELRVIPLFPEAQTIPSSNESRCRRLIPVLDLPLSVVTAISRSEERSVVTGSSSEEPTSHGITHSRHGVLERRIRRGLPRYEPVRAIQLPDKEFRSSLIRTLPNGTALPLMPFPACRHAEGTISSTGVPDVWRMASEDSD